MMEDRVMLKQNLAQLTQQIADEYAGSTSYVVPTGQISLTEAGHLRTGRNEFTVRREASEQFAHLLEIPTPFYLKLEPDLRALLFNRRFAAFAADRGFGRDVQIRLDKGRQVVGYDDPGLLRISPVKLVEAMNFSLPTGLSAEQVGVADFNLSPGHLHVSLFSPERVAEPRPGDYINGGIDVMHYMTGELGTQVHCYLRRLICSNGAITHVCSDNRQVRARRLANGQFDEKDMLNQISRLFLGAWGQVSVKLDAVGTLLNTKRVSMDFIRQQRTRFSLNNRILKAIEWAVREDELGSTDTQFDWFNALSRVATHTDRLTARQRQTLGRMAGEFSQHTIHRCSECGSWIVA
jgi:hypothetical protein